MPRSAFGREKGVRFEQSRNSKIEEGGLVKLSGDFLVDHKDEILNLINHEGRLAKERSKHGHISKVDKANGGILVETTDHNLALRIGKALSRAYKGKHNYKFLKGEKFVEVEWRRD